MIMKAEMATDTSRSRVHECHGATGLGPAPCADTLAGTSPPGSDTAAGLSSPVLLSSITLSPQTNSWTQQPYYLDAAAPFLTLAGGKPRPGTSVLPSIPSGDHAWTISFAIFAIVNSPSLSAVQP